MLSGDAKVVDFLAAVGCPAGDDHASRHVGMLRHGAANGRVGRVVSALDDEGHFVIVVILFEQRAEVGFQIEIDALARSE